MNRTELIQREIIWNAFSYFYLDRELKDKDYEYISNILIGTTIDLKVLKEIDLYEVFPSLYLNLRSSAGEWAGFDATWLNEKCLANYKKRVSSRSFRVFTQMKNKIFYLMRSDHWQEIEKRINSNTRSKVS